MSSSSRFGLGARRHAISIAESYRRQATGGRTLLEQQAKDVKQKQKENGGPMILHQHDHADSHVHHHYGVDEHGEPDEDNVVTRKPETIEGRRR